MSTHSAIVLANNNGYTGIYCHSDGYIGHVGRILKKYYSELSKVQELINLGDLSRLYKNIKPKDGEKHSFDKPVPDVTVAYHRDRGENLNIAVGSTLKAVTDFIDHGNNIYVFQDGKWTYNRESF
jgi:hypothetical protein